ncbi:MAG: ribosomal biosis GTPase [Moraxellaceae bacterium]|jgi:ribosome biogenesis GTPase A|nr:ribosomal biosis GTPase [Moraxellaceae bacterium]
MISINWFPGHMAKAIKDIREILPKVDLVIEVLDARIPYSSANPVIEEFRGGKPALKVLTKSDLADPVMTERWLAHFDSQDGVRAIALTTEQPEQIRQLASVCRKLMAGRSDHLGNITALITGIPNVGKSTLINILAGRTIAKTGNEPAITKGQQRIDLDNGLVLIDSPGILWPKIHNPASGYRLALTGAIKDTAIDHDDIAFWGVALFLKRYPALMKQRYKLETLPELEVEFLEIVGRQRGCLTNGGRVDLNKICTVVLNEFRTATIGRITLESPEEAVAEQIIVQRALDEKAAIEAEKKKQRKQAFKARTGKPGR